jgi:hypothetical protein
MVVLALKLLLAPSFVVGASLAVRRLGPSLGGLISGLPVIAVPILFVLALTHDAAFAAAASRATLLGMGSLMAFVVTYAWLARNLEWVGALLLGWAAFAATTIALALWASSPSAGVSLAAALGACALGAGLLPRPAASGAETPTPRWDLQFRAVAAAVMVVVITAVAAPLGAQLAGLVTTFPVITSILAAFTHAQCGYSDVARVLRGMVRGFVIYAIGVFVFAMGAGIVGS